MSLLTLVQHASRRLGLAVPNSVIGNTNTQVSQMLALANEEGEELASRYGWQALLRENAFTLVLSQDQGSINGDVVADEDFDYLINDTIWNRSLSEPILGPLASQGRQALAAFPVTGPYQRFWIRGGNLYIDPVPSSADTCAFEYKSKAFCRSATGTHQTAWMADSDTGLLDESVMRLGLIWRWKQAKGLNYQEEFLMYERRVVDAMGRDGGKPRLSLNNGGKSRLPGVIVPQGNWNL